MRGCSADGMQGLPCTCKGGSHGGGGEGEGGGGEGDGGGGLGLGGGDGDGGGGEGVGGGRGLGGGLCTLQGVAEVHKSARCLSVQCSDCTQRDAMEKCSSWEVMDGRWRAAASRHTLHSLRLGERGAGGGRLGARRFRGGRLGARRLGGGRRGLGAGRRLRRWCRNCSAEWHKGEGVGDVQQQPIAYKSRLRSSVLPSCQRRTNEAWASTERRTLLHRGCNRV